MALCAHVTDAEHSCISKLPLDGQVVVLGVRQAVRGRETRRTGNREILVPVYRIIRILRRSVGRRKGDGKALPFRVSCRTVSKGRGKEWRLRAYPKKSVRGITNFVETRQVFEGSVEEPEPHPYTSLSRAAKKTAPQTLMDSGRIR